MGSSWGINESTAYRIIKKVENILIQAKELRLPGKKRLIQDDCQLETVVVDVSETPIKRPKKKQKQYFSGKKKKHTLKAQIIINQKNGQILCTAYGKGKEHDFKVYKKSKVSIKKEIKCLADKGYQRKVGGSGFPPPSFSREGIQKYHAFSQTPKKKPRKNKLSPLDKKANRELAQERVLIENIFAQLKKFRIKLGRYRNRGKRFGLRFNLIACLYNYELTLGLNPLLT